MKTMAVFHRVARREISADAGAKILMEQREQDRSWTPARPTWMPVWVYAVLAFVVAVFLVPFVASDRRA